MKKFYSILSLFLISITLFTGCTPSNSTTPTITEQPIYETEHKTIDLQPQETQQPTPKAEFDINSIPDYNGKPYVSINNNIPYFTEKDYTTNSFESYSPLDSHGRCGVAFACIGSDIMPTEERGNIGSVKPSGWHSIRYECVDGLYLYNRCHLLGYQLTGENANEKNLITGTRSLNVDAMLDFENMVADYVKETNNHVLYRVTPIFEGNNLLSTGVLMEGYSVEDNGEAICFNVFCYNEQPGIIIDHSNGDSRAEGGSAPYGSSETVTPAPKSTPTPSTPSTNSQTSSYIGNKNTKKFHYPYCHSVKQMKEKNKKYLNCTRDEAISQGYVPCKNCNP